MYVSRNDWCFTRWRFNAQLCIASTNLSSGKIFINTNIKQVQFKTNENNNLHIAESGAKMEQFSVLQSACVAKKGRTFDEGHHT